MHADRQFDDRLANAVQQHRCIGLVDDEAHQPVEVGTESTGEHLAPCLVFDLGERSSISREVGPQPGERFLGRRVEEGVLTDTDVFVAGGAVDGPRRRQRLAGRQDLLHEQPPMLADASAEAGQVCLGLGQTVDVVDADTGEGRVVDEACGDGVDDLDDGRLLGANGDEVVDREEAAHVASRVPPPLQPVVLTLDGLDDRQVVGAGCEREPQRPVAQFRPEVAVADREATCGDHVDEWVAELRHDHPTIGSVPVDIEPSRPR